MKQFAQPRRRRVGPLWVIEFTASEAAETILCLHGYGADAADLAPLASELELEMPARWIFPDAPLTLPWGGRAWFPIDDRELAEAQTQGRHIELAHRRPSGFDAARGVVGEFLAALGAPWESLIVGGFSQGAMMAVELALRAPRAPRGLVALSGVLLDEAATAALVPARAGLEFFQSHGRQDPLLSFEGARALEKTLVAGGMKSRFAAFDGGHELPPDVLSQLRSYLNAALKKT